MDNELIEIVLANKSNLEEIMVIVKQAQDFIKSQGFEQWTNGYPSREQFEKDIDKSSCYIMKNDGIIVGFMTLLFEEEKAYDVLEGEWITNLPYGVIHRSAIAESFRGHHALRFFFEFAQSQAIERNIESLRIDTHEKNIPMRKSIESFGFVYCGTVSYGPNQQRVAYEKKIKFS